MTRISSLPRWLGLCCSALALTGLIVACGGGDSPEATPTSMTLEKIGGFEGGSLGAAEITAFDATTGRLFVVNGAKQTVDVLDLRDPKAPQLVGTINVASLGAGVNSVAAHDGLIALAIEAAPKTNPGVVALYNASNLLQLEVLAVGALPDMLTFTPDGTPPARRQRGRAERLQHRASR